LVFGISKENAVKFGTYAEARTAGFNERQAGMIARFGVELKSEMLGSAPAPSNTFRFFRAWVTYTIDLAIAVAAWTFGFGLEVKSWVALIGLGIVSRFFFYVLQNAFMRDDIQAYRRRE
jgi:hypothetical protein